MIENDNINKEYVPVERYRTGHPVMYRPEMCDFVVQLFRNGDYTIASIAAALHVTKRTIFRWRKKYPEFDEAIDMGMTYAEAKWTDKMNSIAMSNKQCNTAMAIFLSKVKFNWSDRIYVQQEQVNAPTQAEYEKDMMLGMEILPENNNE